MMARRILAFIVATPSVLFLPFRSRQNSAGTAGTRSEHEPEARDVMRLRYVRHGAILLILLVAGIAAPSMAAADDDIKGVITGRGNDGTVTVRTDDEMDMILVMTEASKVRQVDGTRQVRHGSRTLMPGLRVHASGVRQGSNRFVVNRVTFERSDLKLALANNGGADPTGRANRPRTSQTR
jgi:hypothetical protein